LFYYKLNLCRRQRATQCKKEKIFTQSRQDAKATQRKTLRIFACAFVFWGYDLSRLDYLKTMKTFRLPAATQIGHAHLQVPDLERALNFYKALVGFKEISRHDQTAILSATGKLPAHFLLTARAGAKPKPPRTTGLFHNAIRFPNRRELALVFRRLIEQGWPFQGFADHIVSEALYLADPDGNGVELYTDRPREQWRWRNGEVEMATDPLDVDELLREMENDSTSWNGVHPHTDIGHVHLHVSDLQKAEAFYHGVLGFDVTQRSYPGALFVSAGGYHHHLGLNIWAGKGAPPPPPDAVGLLSFSMTVPDEATLETLKERLQAAGSSFEDRSAAINRPAISTRDQNGNGIEIVVA
jgi:catechol 2,3-dioxygenase